MKRCYDKVVFVLRTAVAYTSPDSLLYYKIIYPHQYILIYAIFWIVLLGKWKLGKQIPEFKVLSRPLHFNSVILMIQVADVC